jgi:hypothetical protein
MLIVNNSIIESTDSVKILDSASSITVVPSSRDSMLISKCRTGLNLTDSKSFSQLRKEKLWFPLSTGILIYSSITAI